MAKTLLPILKDMPLENLDLHELDVERVPKQKVETDNKSEETDSIRNEESKDDKPQVSG